MNGGIPNAVHRALGQTPSVWSSLAFFAGWSFAVAIALAHKLTVLGSRNGIPGRDAGVFATIGRGITEGNLPYRDFWDHKPPGVYYLDALVFSILPANPWSLRLSEMLIALLTLAAFYWLLRGFAPRSWAALGTAIFASFSTLPAISGGTGALLMLPVVIAYGASLRYLRISMSKGWPHREAGATSVVPLAIAGAAVGGAALFKQPGALHLAGVGLAVLLAHLGYCRSFQPAIHRRSPRSILTHLAVVALAFAAVVLPVMAYFVFNGVTSDLWSQVIDYNRVYVGAISLREGADNFLESIRQTKPILFLWNNAVIAALIVFRLPEPKASPANRASCESATHQVPVELAGDRGRIRATASLLTVWFLLDAFGTAVGGRFYQHYFLMTVPSSVALWVYAFACVFSRLRPLPSMPRPWAVLLVVLMLQSLAGTLFISRGGLTALETISRLESQYEPIPAGAKLNPGLANVMESGSYPLLNLGGWQLKMRAESPGVHQRVAREIALRTTHDDHIYVWGAEAMLYFLSDRRSSSRYIYNYPLIDRFGETYGHGYATRQMHAEFLAELAAQPPQLVIVSPEHVETLSLLPEFERGLVRCYRVAARLEDYQMYEPIQSSLDGCWGDG